MSPLALSCLTFALVLGGIVLGSSLRRVLPQHHLSKDSQDVVRLGASASCAFRAFIQRSRVAMHACSVSFAIMRVLPFD